MNVYFVHNLLGSLQAEDVPEEEKQSREEARRIENEKEEQETCQKLARLLVDRLSPYLTGDKAVFISLNKTEVDFPASLFSVWSGC